MSDYDFIRSEPRSIDTEGDVEGDIEGDTPDIHIESIESEEGHRGGMSDEAGHRQQATDQDGDQTGFSTLVQTITRIFS